VPAHSCEIHQAGLRRPVTQSLPTPDMTKHNIQIGEWGELQAIDYLVKRGYQVLARNVRTPHGEIDVITQQGEIVVFVEVKTRTTKAMGLPEESISPRKQVHMLQAAAYYAAEHGIDHWQLDAIAVQGKPGLRPIITHFENAVQS